MQKNAERMYKFKFNWKLQTNRYWILILKYSTVDQHKEMPAKVCVRFFEPIFHQVNMTTVHFCRLKPENLNWMIIFAGASGLTVQDCRTYAIHWLEHSVNPINGYEFPLCLFFSIFLNDSNEQSGQKYWNEHKFQKNAKKIWSIAHLNWGQCGKSYKAKHSQHPQIDFKTNR